MTALDRSAPGVRVTALPDPHAASGVPVDLGQRIVSFSYEESDVRADKMSLELDNGDAALFDRAELLGGALLEVSWGYPGDMAPLRRVVVTKLRGFTTLVVEAQALTALWNDAVKTSRWTNATRSDVARAVAASRGFEGASVLIDDTRERFDVINQAAETDAWFLRRLATQEHFLFLIDAVGFHFHARRQTDAPDKILTYAADLARGDVQSLTVESDLTRRIGSVAVRGRDPMNKTTLTATSTAATVDRGTLGDILEVFDPETGAGSSRPWNATASVHPSAVTSEAQAGREADARFQRAEECAVVLSVDVVGDPSLHARSIVELRGLPARLAGKYRVREAKHRITGSGYAIALKLTRDAVNAAPASVPTKEQGGERNTAAAKAGGELEAFETFDHETGAGRTEFRRASRALGAGDPEGSR